MDVNDVFEKLGFMKKWQVMVIVLVFVLLQPGPSWNKYSIIFIGYSPEHHCKIPINSSTDEWIPKKKDGGLESCSMYVNSSVNNRTIPCTEGWEYDKEYRGFTIVEEWDLVCDKGYYAELSQALFGFGEMLACILFVGLSDIFGRKKIQLIFLLLTSLIGIANSLSTNYSLFAFWKFVLGACNGVVTGIYPVYMAEITSKSNRPFVLSITSLYGGIINSVFVIIAYFIPNWRELEMSINLYPLLVLFILSLYLPESVYWLHANNRVKEAEEILMKAGKMNGIQFTTPILTPLKGNIPVEEKEYFEEKSFFEKFKMNIIKIYRKTFQFDRMLSTQYSYKELFKNRYLLKHMSISFYIFSVIFINVGMNLISASISSHRYVSSFISLLVSLPASVFCMVLSKRLNTRVPMILFMFLLTLLILLNIAVFLLASEEVTTYTKIVFNVLAKFLVISSWTLSLPYISNLFPTNLRSRAVAACYFFARFGVALASFSPYVLRLSFVWLHILFAVLALLGGLVLLNLPDVQHFGLPETIKDIENIYKKNENIDTKKLISEWENAADEEQKEERDSN